LKKAGTIFDLEQIQLIAALKGKLSDEDRKRVELQLAILTGNTEQAQKLTYELAIAQGLNEKIARDLASLDFKNNPFASWQKYLDDLALKAQTIAINPSQGSWNGWNNNPSFPETMQVPDSNVTPFPRSTPGSWRRAEEQSNFTGPIQLSVNIDGKAVASALQDQSLSGNNTNISRIGR
jgi:hypothetical protein